ncbi:MAG TPA: hypothetical protein VNJ04_04960 [Gemmatimonadaceae bacterium]|nr:hypothetical protein [Gemmatimonadaceae bacterium]
MTTLGAIPEHASSESAFPTRDNSALRARVLTSVTPRQAELVATIRALHLSTGCWPSGAGVARALGVNPTSVRRRLRNLERIGVILWAGGDVRIAREPDGLFLTMAEVRA